jgi:hypothetical protein
VPDVHTYPGLAALRSHTRGAASVRVAMIDGPVDRTHPCFSGATLTDTPAGWTRDDSDDDGFIAHGTGIASMLFGQPDTPVEGVAPFVTGILIAAATHEDDITELSLVRALDAALDAGADIIHCAFCLSRGAPQSTVSAHLARSLATARERGVLIVAPSGNDAGTATCAPADQDHVIAVGSLNNDLTVRATSNYGSAFHGHGVMAIGEDVRVATPGGDVAQQNGTSVAAPWVTGTAALLLSVSRNWGLDLNAVTCGELLRKTAAPLDAARAIGGALDPTAALHALEDIRLAARGVTVSQSDIPRVGVNAPVKSPTSTPGRLVYVLGQLSCEPVDDPAFDRLQVAMRQNSTFGTPDSPFSLLTHLRSVASDSDLVHFVVSLGQKPRYVLTSYGAHARDVIDRLIALASASIGVPAIPALIDRVAIPGVISGETVRLQRGDVVPQLFVGIPDALTGWRTHDVADAALTSFSGVTTAARDLLVQLLDRVCEAAPNDGVTAADRTRNYTAANATPLAHVAIAMAHEHAQLAGLRVQPSRYDRPRSDCWDVLATFFDPTRTTRSLWQWVWTVDVGDVRPVTINWPRMWRLDANSSQERQHV